MSRIRDPGLGYPLPTKVCNDRDCPYHGNIKVRGILLEGVLVSKKMDKAGVVMREYLHYDKKYKRYERRRSKLSVHIPPCIDVREGDVVVIGETRPISKTISFVVVYNKSSQSSLEGESDA
jgi:small subunit ribosomal protein S17